jgi:hypothetical protein
LKFTDILAIGAGVAVGSVKAEHWREILASAAASVIVYGGKAFVDWAVARRRKKSQARRKNP